MANDLVVQLGAKLDQFTSDMNQAGDIADSAVSRIEQSFSSLNPGINFTSVDAAFTLITGGASAALALVVAMNKSLSDTADQAERAGLSLERIQQLKFGANAIGVGDTDFSNSLEKFVSNLQDAKSKSNDLLRVFQANGVSITDSNGKIKDTNDLLTKAVDIIKRAPSIQDALQIGNFLGVSKQFSQSIYDTGDNFLRLASEANAAGAVIDDATIAKAKTFTTEWTKAIALWGAQLRGALGDTLPLLNDLVYAATKFIDAVKTAYNFVSAIKDFAIAPKIDTASLNQLNSLLKQYQDIKDTLDAGKPLNPTQLFVGSNIQNSDHQITKDAVDKAIQDINVEIAKRQKDVSPVRVPVTGGATSTNPGIKQHNEAADAYDRATESVEKYTARLEAEAQAQGFGAAAIEEAKAQAQLLTAAQQAGIPITQKVRDEIQDLAQDAGLAAEALEKAKVATSISRGQQTSFLSPEDVQIANQLKGLYPDVATALESVEAAALRANQAFSGISSQIGGDLTSGLADIVSGTKSVKDGFDSLAESVIKDIEQMIIKLTIVGPLMRALQTGFGASGLGSLFSGGSPSSTAVGGPFQLSGSYANGTDFAPGGMSLVGENGPELVNLPRGAQVIPNAALRNGGSGAITINNYTDGQATVQRGPNGDATITIKKMVDQAVGDSLANGTGRRVLGGSYGVKPFTGQ